MTNLRMTFDAEEDGKIEAIKRKVGIKATTELIRYLITDYHKELQVGTKP